MNEWMNVIVDKPHNNFTFISVLNSAAYEDIMPTSKLQNQTWNPVEFIK